MNNADIAKITRNTTVKTFLNDNGYLFSSSRPFNLQQDICIAAFKDADDKAVKAGIDLTGHTDNKTIAKKLLSEDASELCGLAYVRWENLGKHDLSAQMHINASDYTHTSDSSAATMAQAAHDLMLTNIDDLKDYVALEDLTKFQTTITNFINTQGTSASAHAISPADTAAFAAAIKVSDLAIKNLLIVAKPFKKTNKTAYDGLVLACQTPHVNVHHTYVTVTITYKADNTPVAGAKVEIEAQKKSATTDATGTAKLDKVKAGKATLKITIAGVVTTMDITVARGKDTVVSVGV